MQQALRPSAAIIDPSLSAPYEVVKPYLYPQANLDKEPDFFHKSFGELCEYAAGSCHLQQLSMVQFRSKVYKIL
jgi:hypothetical protein